MPAAGLLLALLLTQDPEALDSAPPERERVGGWTVEYGGEGDGGLYVLMTRTVAGVSGEYRLVFWRGNHRLYGSYAARRGSEPCGGADGTIDRIEELDAGRIARALEPQLAACGLSPAQRRAFLYRLGAPVARFSARAQEALDATIAEAEAIANHGREPR